MRRSLVVLAVALVLLLGLGGQALAQTPTANQEVTASFTVGEVIDLTIQDFSSVTYPGSGLLFGQVTANGMATPEVAQNGSTPAVRLSLGSTTNVTVKINSWGTPFSAAGASLGIENLKYRVDSPETTSALTTMDALGSPTLVKSGLSRNQSASVWYWLYVPSDTPAGTYNATVYFKAEK